MPKNETFCREEVLRKITHVFWDKGFDGTSMQDIVDASGLNRSSLYNSFGDKQALFMEVLRAYQQQGQSSNLSQLTSGMSPRKILRSVLEAGTAINKPDQKKGCLLVNCTPYSHQNDDVKEFLVDNLEAMVSFFTEVIKEGQKIGEFDKSSAPETLALYFFAALQGLKSTILLTDNQSDIEQLIDTILSKV